MDIVQSQFSPGSDTGAIANSLMQGLQVGSSLAERGQIARQRQQQMDQQDYLNQRQKAIDTVMEPVRQAQAQADIAAAKAQVNGSIQAEAMRQQANEILPQARSDFNEMMKISDPDAREQAGFEWVGKYGQLANVGTFKPEFENYKDIVAKNHSDASTLRLLQAKAQDEQDLAYLKGKNDFNTATVRADAQRDTTEIKAAASTQNTGTRVAGTKDVANIRAGAMTDVADTNAGARTEAATIHAGATIGAAKIKAEPNALKMLDSLQEAKAAGADPEVLQGIRDNIKKVNGAAAGERMPELEKYLDLRDKALARGDQVTAAIYQKAIEKKNHQSQSTADVLAQALNPTGAASDAPAKAAAPAPVVPAKVAPMTDSQLHDFFFGSKKK